MRKYLILGALVLGMPACEILTTEIDPSVDCGERPLPYYDVQGITASLTRQPDGKPRESVAAGATVASPELRLLLVLQERYYAARPAVRFISSAYACSVAPSGFRGTEERMDSLSITSLQDYDAQHPAGTSLIDIVESKRQTQWQIPSRQNPKEPFRIAELTLKVPPAAAGTQKFRVYYRQTNGEVYTAETDAVVLLP